MNKCFSSLGLTAATLLFLTGCMENAALLNLKKDGSGTLTYRIYISSGIMQMFHGIATGMGTDGGNTGSVDPLESLKADMEDKFGDAATLVKTKEIANEQGWEGIEAIYSFDDVNKLNLAGMGDEIDSGDGGDQGMGKMGTPYRCSFTKGDTATLKIIPITTDPEAAKEAAEDLPGVMADMGMEGMGDLGLAMMKPMMKGMRITLLLSVDGEIVETNSSFKSEKHPNVITLMDLRMDQLLEHPQAMEIMKAGADGADKLAALNLPGIKIENPQKEITVSFK